METVPKIEYQKKPTLAKDKLTYLKTGEKDIYVNLFKINIKKPLKLFQYPYSVSPEIDAADLRFLRISDNPPQTLKQRPLSSLFQSLVRAFCRVLQCRDRCRQAPQSRQADTCSRGGSLRYADGAEYTKQFCRSHGALSSAGLPSSRAYRP